MTCFNTCAYPGCDKRIPYEIGGSKPDKYCPDHQRHMDERVANSKKRK